MPVYTFVRDLQKTRCFTGLRDGGRFIKKKPVFMDKKKNTNTNI